jgi:hypothetical protein
MLMMMAVMIFDLPRSCLPKRGCTGQSPTAGKFGGAVMTALPFFTIIRVGKNAHLLLLCSVEVEGWAARRKREESLLQEVISNGLV